LVWVVAIYPICFIGRPRFSGDEPACFESSLVYSIALRETVRFAPEGKLPVYSRQMPQLTSGIFRGKRCVRDVSAVWTIWQTSRTD
jgi:hypothetical protein